MNDLTTSRGDRLAATFRLARSGDSDAFDRLFAALAPRLEMFVRLELRKRGGGGRIGPAQTEDVVQETFVSAHDALGRVEWLGERALLGWLCGIARHRILQLGERDGAAKRSPERLERISGFADRLARSTRGVVTLAARREQRARLEGALDRLEADDRAIVVMRYFESLELARIAERTGRSESAVRRVLARAVRSLGTLLREEDA